MDINLIGLIVLAIIFVFVTFRFGKSYLVAFLLAFYPAYFLFDLIKDDYVVSNESIVVIGIFAASFALMMYIMRKTINAGFSFSPVKRWVDSIILTLGAISQIALVYYYILPQLNSLYALSGPVANFFSNTVSYGVLALIPFVALVISARD